jgi:hypothetical protein
MNTGRQDVETHEDPAHSWARDPDRRLEFGIDACELRENGFELAVVTIFKKVGHRSAGQAKSVHAYITN